MALAGHVGAVSVGELVRRRTGAEPDAWYLALVQRDEKWDQVRMRYLLDSLLAGYPVGTLLVCQVTEGSRVFRFGSTNREGMDADSSAWQLLDGQQRINALFSMFTTSGRYGRFFLHMGVARPEAVGPVTGRRARDEGLGYIHWTDGGEADSAVPDRPLRIDLSRWYDWAEGDGGRRLARAIGAIEGTNANIVAILNEIDPEFTDSPQGLDVEVAQERLARLISLWGEPSIPVEYRLLESPMDVLEAFTRVNRAGVQVAGPDLFFAAVKTLWPDAEKVIAATAEALTPRLDDGIWDALIDRTGVLRVLGRLAARALLRVDLVPLAIDRLTGVRGRQLIEVMQEIASPTGPALRRMAALMSVIAQRSSLGFGLYAVDLRLFDPVLAWAAVHPKGDDRPWLELNLGSIDAFLLGATSFRWASVLGDRFARLAMTEALAAGVVDEAFPVDRIPPVARGANASLTGGRDRVRALESSEDKLRWADSNATLLLSVLQRIEFRSQRDVFDWDHIYPQAQAYRMWSPGPDGRWRRHHQYRRFVGSAGNLWGLDAGTNRAMRDKLPAQKFNEIRQLTVAGQRPIWPTDRWWLTEHELAAFAEVGIMLERGEIDPAMEIFHDVTVGRALGMVDEVLRRMPVVGRFAANADVAPADPRPDPNIVAALGLTIPQLAAEPISVVGAMTTDSRVATVLIRADQFGTGDALRALVSRAVALGLQVRGYKHAITLTPPTTRSVALVAITPQDSPRGTARTWVAPDTFARSFPSLPQQRFYQLLSGIRGALLTPSEIDALADQIEAALQVVR